MSPPPQNWQPELATHPSALHLRPTTTPVTTIWVSNCSSEDSLSMNHGHAAEFIKSKGDSNMTRLLKLLLNRNLLSAAAFAGALAPQALIAADALCPLESSTFHGTYLIAGGGMRVGVGTIAAVGEI